MRTPSFYLPLKCLPLALLLLSNNVNFAQSGGDSTEIDLNSKISSVTVFLEGAEVSRQAKATVPAGRSTQVFKGLTADLDPGSLQVSGETQDFIILSVSHRLNFYEVPEPGELERGLREKIARLEDRRRRLETELSIAKEEEALLRANRELAGSDSGLDAEDLERGVNFHRERISAIRLTYLALGDSLRNNREDRETLQQQLAELGKAEEQPATSEVVVVTEGKRNSTADLQLKYLVAEAGWTPEYDVRVTDISQPIDLRYRAKVHQRSGEDWEDVELILSTGDPTLSARAPALRTWRLYPNRRPPVYQPVRAGVGSAKPGVVSGTVVDEDGMPLVGASILVQGTSTGTVTDFDGKFSIPVPSDAEDLTISYTGFDAQTVAVEGEKVVVTMKADVSLSEVVVTGYATEGPSEAYLEGDGLSDYERDQRRIRSQQLAGKKQDRNELPPAPVPVDVQRRATTIAFAIELPYDISSDGKSRRVEIKQHQVPASYQHLAVPKYSADAFLTASFTDWEQFDLISGNLQLFFEGTYLGQSFLDVGKTTDTLELSLGRDPGVVIVRAADEEFRKNGSFLGGRRVDSRGWTISVRNTKDQPIRLTVLDQVPVSADNDLDVSVNIPKTTTYDEETGQLTWKLSLSPKEEGTMRFGYSVRHPRGKRVFLE